MIVVYFVNLTEDINTPCGKKFICGKSGGIYSNHWTLIIQSSELSLNIEQIGLQVTLCASHDIRGSNLGRDTCYPE
jgi:hypothetical protein